ncbi:hypothetical protein M514_23785 [Trichuris suis]|uniref:HAT C-terminal dimerisation domain-containing protein n=1 Tax=Trichuris suis TaxID=68888 RepID=A0A085N3M9_9BILA|nr:hypothetical protein M514_23785 [Trichuris suis]
MKPSKLKLHFTRCHPDKNGKDVSYFRALREKLMKRRALSTSYKISLLIAQTGKPHTIGEELLIPAIAEAVETVLQQRGRDVTNKIPLSNDTVQRRINAMAEDVEDTLCSWLRQSEFSLQVDESTLPGNEAVLLAYVSDADVEVYREHLRALHNDFASRFEDILSVAIPDWVINPFASIEDEEISLQLELLDLQSNAELKPKLAEGYQRFWLQKQIPVLYPTVWAVVKRWLIRLPSSSLVERAFSVVMDLITKKRNWLQLVKRGDLRLWVTSISPNIDKLVRSQLCEPSTSR